jgi:hypothetical protein
MPTGLTELQAALAIDKSALDDEVIRQPVLFYAISEQLTEANAELDAAKEDLATVRAEIDAIWRAKLGKNGNKVTEKMVENCVQTSNEREKAFDNYLKAKIRANKLSDLKEAFLQRSYMLKHLVELYATNYFEDSAIKPSRSQDAAHYSANRVRMSEGREKRLSK